MDPCLLYAPIVSIAVTILKRIPFIGKHPKVVAAVLSLVAAVIGAGADWRQHLQQLVLCVVAILTGAIAFHEVVAKPVAERFSPPQP